MAFPPGDYLRITVRGGAPGSESWSINHYQEVTGLVALPTPAALQGVCNSNETAAGTMWATLKTHCTAAMTFTGLNQTFIRNGVTIFSNQTNEAAAVAGSGATVQPSYVARVVTLLTNRSGRSYRGRMYLPYNSGVITSATGLFTSDATTLGAVKTFMLACTANILTLAGAATAGPVVYSITAGAHDPVTSLRMDNKPDTQRGREKGMQPSIFDTVSIP
jgi:hypothetical protein